MKYFSLYNEKTSIGLYNIPSAKFIPSAPIKSQSAQKFFYGKDGKVEEWLSDVENNMAPIFSNIISNQKLPEWSSAIHLKLIHFLIVLDLRNPVHKNEIEKGFELFKEKLNRHNVDNSDSDIQKAFDSIDNDQLFNESLLEATSSIPYLIDLNFKLIRNTTSIPFIISDNPMVNYNQFLEHRNWKHSSHNGYGAIGRQIYFPLNHEYLIAFYDSGIYKIGNKKEKIVTIDSENEIHQLNILQYLNCNQNLYFNQLASRDYIQNLVQEAEKYIKANKPYSKVVPILDKSTGNLKKNEEIITIGSSDAKINLTIAKIKMHSKSKGIKFDNHVVQLRPKVKQHIEVNGR
ncbi:DUF4238 domain-containing protein [Flavobacteriaceae bacterium S0825]|nr:DUF4238 domain-containing protein [Flavobacteriaceae bacterium S0825]NIX64323.1 DUF4238 domain-containing protein [Gaetbulibacter sp. S0825]